MKRINYPSLVQVRYNLVFVRRGNQVNKIESRHELGNTCATFRDLNLVFVNDIHLSI